MRTHLIPPYTASGAGGFFSLRQKLFLLAAAQRPEPAVSAKAHPPS